MSKGPTKLQRWLDLIAYLVGRRLPVPVDELMEHVPAYAVKWVDGGDTDRASARRMFERDKDELRRAGIPIRTVRYSINYGHEEVEGYRLERRDFYLPYIRLLSAEGVPRPQSGVALFEIAESGLDLALRALRRSVRLPSFPYGADARSALRKLSFDLDRVSEETDPPVLFLERPGEAGVREILRELSEALLQRKRVRFRYHGLYRGEETEREVAPYALLFQQGHWYLVGHDEARQAVRVFRAGRMQDVARNTRTPNTPDYAVPPDFRLDDHIGRRAWEFDNDGDRAVTALVRFRFPHSLWAERAGHGRLIERLDDGSAIHAFEISHVDPFVRWLLGCEDGAEVLDPPEIRQAVAEGAATIAAKHGESREDRHA